MALRERRTVRSRGRRLRVRIFTAAICRGTLRIAGEERLRGAEEELLQWYAGILLCPDMYTQPILVYYFSRRQRVNATRFTRVTKRLDICIIHAVLFFHLFSNLLLFTFFSCYFIDGYSFSICMHRCYFNREYVHFAKNQRNKRNQGD